MNLFYKARYDNFILSRPKRRRIDSEEPLENHHILPRSLGGTDEENNLILLSLREHYLAHYMLAKVYNGRMWLAFNMMKRTIQGDIKKSSLYELSRKYILEQISLCNTGRKMSDENRRKVSERTANTASYRFPDGQCRRLNINDPIIAELGLKTGAYGSRRRPDSKKLTEPGTNKGKIAYHNPVTSDIKFFENNKVIHDGYFLGYPESHSNMARARFTEAGHYHNPETGEHVRIKQNQSIPNGFISGRLNGCGFSSINKYRKLVDMKAKKVILYMEETNEPDHFFNIPLNANCFVFGSWVMESLKVFKEIFPELSTHFDKPMKSHFNMENIVYHGHKKYEGLILETIGFKKIKVKEFKHCESFQYINKRKVLNVKNNIRDEFERAAAAAARA